MTCTIEDGEGFFDLDELQEDILALGTTPKKENEDEGNEEEGEEENNDNEDEEDEGLVSSVDVLAVDAQ